MRKRILALGIAVSLLGTSTIAYAAGPKTISATIAGLKMFFKGKQLTGDVLTAGGKTYIPTTVLTNDLGFTVSTDIKNNKLNFIEKVSKDSLLNQISDLKSKNSNLEANVKDLNEKLKLYRGDVPSDSEYISAPNLLKMNPNPYIYSSYWNRVTPFKVDGMVYDSSSVWGIKFDNKINANGNFACPAFNFANKNLAYTSLKFSCSQDELGSSFNNREGSRVYVFGISSSLGSKLISSTTIDNTIGINTVEVNIKGYDYVVITFIPPFEKLASSTNTIWKDPTNNNNYFNQFTNLYTDGWYINYYADYILFMNPQVK